MTAPAVSTEPSPLTDAEHAADLIAEPLALIKQVLIKYETACVEEWKAAVRARMAENELLAAQLSAANKRLAEVEKDAERYRQTRKMSWRLDYTKVAPVRPDKFDELIDSFIYMTLPAYPPRRRGRSKG